uniref:G-protein coupled receptors family 1 profile domain-containing protein n=1 Tax=Meloidogyne floridensis TaxID=298350 RepID=A0A915NJM2_9BILA
MSGFCTDLDEESVKQSQIYYTELLSSLSQRYDSFHKIIYQTICILGVIANICVVVVLLRPTMRKNPFNLFLIGIAICDMSLMASYFIYKQIELCHPLYFTFTWIVFTYSYALFSVLFHSASLWITVNMAVLRYLVLKSSSNSSRNWPRLNTYKAASFSIVAAILIAAVGSAPNMLRYQIFYKGELPAPDVCKANGSKFASFYKEPDSNVSAYILAQPSFWNCTWERFSFWIAGLLLKLVPCLLLTIFMTLLVRMLVEARERRNRLHSGKQSTLSSLPTQTNNGRDKSVGTEKGASASGNSSKIIVAVFLITELPQGILVIWMGIKPQVRFAMAQLSNILDFLSLLNSSVNFLLYATMSNLFRHEFLQTFGQCCPKRFFSLFNSKKKRGGSTDRSSIPNINNKSGGRDNAAHREIQTMAIKLESPPSSSGSDERLNSEQENRSVIINNNVRNNNVPSKLSLAGQEITRIAQKSINYAFSSNNFSNGGNKQRKILVTLDKGDDSTTLQFQQQLLNNNNNKTSNNVLPTLRHKQQKKQFDEPELSLKLIVK